MYHYKNKQDQEGFYPRWHGVWGWNKNYLNDIGNWRPYNHYPAYSGYWKKCSSGSWCPPYVSCNDPECQ